MDSGKSDNTIMETERTVRAAEMFLEGGCISGKLENYEFRPQQADMAAAVEKSLAFKKHLIAEAGTGVGKSLAYLVPLILWAVRKKKKAVVATYTKTLQEQLIKKELPFLEKTLVDDKGKKIEFKFALAVGSGNYLCLRRLNRGRQFGLFESLSSIKEWNRLVSWSTTTKTGLRMDAGFGINPAIWSEVCREPDICLGGKCPYSGGCFFTKARSRMGAADILVANHHLFFSDIASDGRLLPKHDAVVFDEAHNVEEVAAEYLGAEISNTGLNWLLSKIYSPSGKGLIPRLKELDNETKHGIKHAVDSVSSQGDRLFNYVFEKCREVPAARRVRTPGFYDDAPGRALENLYLAMKAASSKLSGEEDIKEVSAYADRCMAMKNAFMLFIGQNSKDFVYWIETGKTGRRVRIALKAAPIEVAEKLKKELYEKKSTVIMTSASLAVDGNFTYLKERLGLAGAEEILLASPFDYSSQAILYIAEDLPDPSRESAAFTDAAAVRTGEIIKISGGRTFVLFTSHSSLGKTHKYLDGMTDGIRLLKQGEAPRWGMLDTFKKDPSSVLLGASTFWQGVDVPGDALRCVVIFKLPFAAPDEPVVEARCEFLKNRGSDPFRNYQIPRAVLMLKQGVGRLIRSKTDTGVIAVLDPRIISRGYGRHFTKSLPDCALARDLGSVRNFLERGVIPDAE